MYSYGGRTAAGGGKRGHGGRNYRPPPEKRDPNSTPPPLKACSCLLEFHLPEYSVTQPQGRVHASFVAPRGVGSGGGDDGRKAVDECEKYLRSNFCVHLVVPGRRQNGPLAIAGKTYREALPAAHELVAHRLVGLGDENVPNIRGKILRNVKDTVDTGIVGAWNIPQEEQEQLPSNGTTIVEPPYYLFESEVYSVLACPLPSSFNTDDESDGNDNANASASSCYLNNLKTCIDNAAFHIGRAAIEELDIFITRECAFCIGKRNQTQIIYDEVMKEMLEK